VADDLTAVPSGELRQVRESARNLTALVLALWAVVLILAATLLRADVIGWPDLLATVGRRG
jgi:hypothetical protein